ncbi:arsenate reductase ArsC [Amycolatopsis sp. H20-H5]|uniref:arsenate reductase ArsC n=1 Tax=Amycolatopsis sp. H20-H5 TaxID=3046309 RepID=UPI002DBB4632|nr:arsenate reductase ArsC [Amycolatopsis sp. H20-H5]MEC3974380.1 arsenate reductase ArsC [Amycolatopsis sp. H20-H5]
MTVPHHHHEGEPCLDVEDCRLIDPRVQILLDREAATLTDRFDGIFSAETVTAVVHDSFDQLAATAKVHTHLPVLAARFARQRLDATAKNEGATVSDLPEVLFVCVHNAGRSQMAAALLNHHGQGRVVVRSAGSAPADSINPAVVAAMEELGLDLTQEFPKPLTTEAVQASDVVITMGCGDACPIFPGKRYLDWQLDDPAGQGIDAVRPIRDEIDRRVQALLAELVPVAT